MSYKHLPSSTIDWASIHKLTFVDQPGCWKTCGSYCCRHESKSLSFNFFKPGVAGMVFFEEEYNFLESRGLLQDGFQKESKRWKFEVDDELSLNFVVSKCALGGICSIPEYRPICCKIYPFLPRIDLETMEVTGFVNGVVFDQFWDTLGVEHPCTLVRERADEVRAGMAPGLKEILKHPYIALHVKAVEHFLDAVSKGFRDLRQEHPTLTSQELSRKWELLYLKRKAFDVAGLKREIRASYDKLQERVS